MIISLYTVIYCSNYNYETHTAWFYVILDIIDCVVLCAHLRNYYLLNLELSSVFMYDLFRVIWMRTCVLTSFLCWLMTLILILLHKMEDLFIFAYIDPILWEPINYTILKFKQSSYWAIMGMYGSQLEYYLNNWYFAIFNASADSLSEHYFLSMEWNKK